ncbi:MAG: tetratricopeptide repeat protein, partial [Phycisphaerales bacterium]
MGLVGIAGIAALGMAACDGVSEEPRNAGAESIAGEVTTTDAGVDIDAGVDTGTGTATNGPTSAATNTATNTATNAAADANPRDDPASTTRPADRIGAATLLDDLPTIQTLTTMVSDGQLGEAEAGLRARLTIDADDAEARLLLGLVHHRRRDYALAEPQLARSLALNPADPRTAHFLGWARFHL